MGLNLTLMLVPLSFFLEEAPGFWQAAAPSVSEPAKTSGPPRYSAGLETMLVLLGFGMLNHNMPARPRGAATRIESRPAR